MSSRPYRRDEVARYWRLAVSGWERQRDRLGQHAVLPLPSAAEPRGIGGWRLAVGSGRETVDAMSSHPYPRGFPELRGME
jgi:hypothetical protein